MVCTLYHAVGVSEFSPTAILDTFRGSTFESKELRITQGDRSNTNLVSVGLEDHGQY